MWLRDEDHDVVRRITRRVADMTNLNQETSELLQVANYGIGGHYQPHYDMHTVLFFFSLTIFLDAKFPREER